MSDIPRARPTSDARPRVLVVYWGARGGGSLFSRLIAERIARDFPSSEVRVSLRENNDRIADFRESGLGVLPIAWGAPRSILAAPVASWRALGEHVALAVAFKPDVAVVTMNSPLCVPFVLRLRRLGIPLVYVAHDAEPHPGDYAATIQRIAQARLLRWSDQVITLSSQVRERLLRSGLARPEGITALPIESVVPLATGALKNVAAGEPLRLLFLGRLLAYKGLPRLIEAVGSLGERPGWHLTIAGDGPMRPLLEAALTGRRNVTLELGWLSEERMNALLADHHVLLCPYEEASQSGVLAQALAYGMPSVVTPQGALPEQIALGQAGWISSASTGEAFGEVLRELVDRPQEVARRSQGALDIVRCRHAHQGWRDVIQRVAAGSSPRAGQT